MLEFLLNYWMFPPLLPGTEFYLFMYFFPWSKSETEAENKGIS